MTTPTYWDQAKRELKKRDKILGNIITRYKGEMLTLRGEAFYTLARSIAGQQISVKAADSVWKRVESGLSGITPRHVLTASEEELRSYGLSFQKIRYLHGLSEFFNREKALVRQWPHMEDEALITSITQIKGIGRWTAEMFLIFHMGRPDIFPVADIGLQKAAALHYREKTKLSMDELIELGENFRPWRSVATWYLWRSLDPIPVEY